MWELISQVAVHQAVNPALVHAASGIPKCFKRTGEYTRENNWNYPCRSKFVLTAFCGYPMQLLLLRAGQFERAKAAYPDAVSTTQRLKVATQLYGLLGGDGTS